VDNKIHLLLLELIIRRCKNSLELSLENYMAADSLNNAHINYLYEDGYWIASCNEVGLVGYQGRDLPTVKKLVLDGLQLYFNDKSFTLIESVSEIEVKK